MAAVMIDPRARMTLTGSHGGIRSAMVDGRREAPSFGRGRGRALEEMSACTMGTRSSSEAETGRVELDDEEGSFSKGESA